ncbi:MAG: hypothetical protein ACRD4H_09215 [Candidatus Acidiferrales bacterium]
MSQNPAYKLPVCLELYELLAARRVAENERLAAQGLPPTDREFPFISSDEIELQQKHRAAQNAQPFAKPTSNRLTAVAKAKILARKESIPGFERHSRKCQICRHPAVDAIEEVYINWYPASDICRYFGFDDPDILYRHAHAAGLDELRRQNMRIVPERLIENWTKVKVTVGGILRSIRALSCLDEKGRWNDLPSTHIILSKKDLPDNTSASSTESGIPGPGVTSSTDLVRAGHTTGEPLESISTPDSVSSTERSETECEGSSLPYSGATSSTDFSNRHASPQQNQRDDGESPVPEPPSDLATRHSPLGAFGGLIE